MPFSPGSARSWPTIALLTDRTCLARSRPLLRLVMDSQLRLPARFRKWCAARAGDVVAVTTFRRFPRTPQDAGSRRRRGAGAHGPGGRADLAGAIDWLGRRRYFVADDRSRQQVELDGRSKPESSIASCFTTARRFWAAWRRYPSPAAFGRRRRVDAIRVHNVTIHPIPPDEFAIEGYVHRIIEELGTVEALETRPAGARLKVRCAAVLPDMTIGGSIAVNGVCSPPWTAGPIPFRPTSAPETPAPEQPGRSARGSRVNLRTPLVSRRPPGRAHRAGPRGFDRRIPLARSLGDDNWWLRHCPRAPRT